MKRAPPNLHSITHLQFLNVPTKAVAWRLPCRSPSSPHPLHLWSHPFGFHNGSRTKRRRRLGKKPWRQMAIPNRKITTLCVFSNFQLGHRSTRSQRANHGDSFTGDSRSIETQGSGASLAGGWVGFGGPGGPPGIAHWDDFRTDEGGRAYLRVRILLSHRRVADLLSIRQREFGVPRCSIYRYFLLQICNTRIPQYSGLPLRFCLHLYLVVGLPARSGGTSSGALLELPIVLHLLGLRFRPAFTLLQRFALALGSFPVNYHSSPRLRCRGCQNNQQPSFSSVPFRTFVHPFTVSTAPLLVLSDLSEPTVPGLSKPSDLISTRT
jgi:hypothetical protein